MSTQVGLVGIPERQVEHFATMLFHKIANGFFYLVFHKTRGVLIVLVESSAAVQAQSGHKSAGTQVFFKVAVKRQAGNMCAVPIFIVWPFTRQETLGLADSGFQQRVAVGNALSSTTTLGACAEGAWISGIF